MWDLIPWPGIEPGPPALGVQSYPLCHQGSPNFILKAAFKYCCQQLSEHVCTLCWIFPLDKFLDEDLIGQRYMLGISLAVQWLRLCVSTAGGTGSIPCQGTKIPHAAQPKKKKKRYMLPNYPPEVVLPYIPKCMTAYIGCRLSFWFCEVRQKWYHDSLRSLISTRVPTFVYLSFTCVLSEIPISVLCLLYHRVAFKSSFTYEGE